MFINMSFERLTPGEYLLPATKAEEMYNPDVFGYDGQYKIVIEDR